VRRTSVVAVALLVALTLTGRADERVDEAIVARIKSEAFQHSRVMDTLSELTDVYGARLRGSPGYAAAAEWVKQRLTDWGFDRVAFEPGGFPGPGWQLIASQGKSGPKGERWLQGIPDVPAVIQKWRLDRDNYIAVPVMSDGREGPPLELRSLFEQFRTEAR